MRLVNTGTYQVEEFVNNAIPKYAILSHTWSTEEVTFQDMQGANAKQKMGYTKFEKSCNLASTEGHKYIWIDTCCIDKSSSAELSEAINSMYRWYYNAEICFAYLADVPADENHYSESSKFRKSRWFTRGWTLQELVAPQKVVFYSADWRSLGQSVTHKYRFREVISNEIADFTELLSEISGVDVNVLKGDPLDTVTVARRMSWAWNRDTTRAEDIAYCLMGIFNTPRRILKSTDDESLFAWKWPDYHGYGLLAESPAAFVQSWDIEHYPDRTRKTSVPSSLTNKGLCVQLLLVPVHFRSKPLGYSFHILDNDMKGIWLALLDCQMREGVISRPGIFLQRSWEDHDQFSRVWSNVLVTINLEKEKVVVREQNSIKEEVPISLALSDLRLETIYVKQKSERVRYMPSIQIEQIVQPADCTFSLAKVYPSISWNPERAIVQLRTDDDDCRDGALHFQNSEGHHFTVTFDVTLSSTRDNESAHISKDLSAEWRAMVDIPEGSPLHVDGTFSEDSRIPLFNRRKIQRPATQSLGGQQKVAKTLGFISGKAVSAMISTRELFERKAFVVNVEIYELTRNVPQIRKRRRAEI